MIFYYTHPIHGTPCAGDFPYFAGTYVWSASRKLAAHVARVADRVAPCPLQTNSNGSVAVHTPDAGSRTRGAMCGNKDATA